MHRRLGGGGEEGEPGCWSRLASIRLNLVRASRWQAHAGSWLVRRGKLRSDYFDYQGLAGWLHLMLLHQRPSAVVSHSPTPLLRASV